MGVCWFFISALRIVQPNCGHQPPTSRVVWFICLESWFGALSEMVYFENPRMVILRMSTAFTVHWIVKKSELLLDLIDDAFVCGQPVNRIQSVFREPLCRLMFF